MGNEWLAGLGEGLKNAVSSYRDTRKSQLQEDEADAEKKFRRTQLAFGLAEKGYQVDPISGEITQTSAAADKESLQRDIEFYKALGEGERLSPAGKAIAQRILTRSNPKRGGSSPAGGLIPAQDTDTPRPVDMPNAVPVSNKPQGQGLIPAANDPGLIDFSPPPGYMNKEDRADAKKRQGEERNRGFQIEQDLRNEFNTKTKDFLPVDAAFKKIQNAAKNPSAAGDMSLIYAYMKIVDPGSTVREGEFANAQNAASIPDRIRNLYNKAANGERLNDNQRNDFVNQAGELYNAQVAQVEEVANQYERLAKDYQGKFPDVDSRRIVNRPKRYAGAPKAAPGAAPKPKTVRQNGVIYTLNPQTGQYE